MDWAILRYPLIATVKHLVNIATVTGPLGRSLLTSQNTSHCRSISAAALISARPDDCSRQLLCFRFAFQNIISYVCFMLNSPNRLIEEPPLLAQIREAGDGNVSRLLGVKMQARGTVRYLSALEFH